MAIVENPRIATECVGEQNNTLRNNCLKFLRDVTLVIACQAETEYNIRHAKSATEVFTNDEKNTCKAQLVRQATIRLLQFYITKNGTELRRIIEIEKVLGHGCSCIFTRMGNIAICITQQHPVSCNVSYMGDIQKLRKITYKSIVEKYRELFVTRANVLHPIFTPLIYKHKNVNCVNETNIMKIIETLNIQK